jgi:hypothetical protein
MSRTVRGLLSISMVMFAVLSTSMQGQAPPAGSGPFVITDSIRVIEADTLEVLIEGRRVGVGLVGVKGPAGNTACGRQAIAALYQLLAAGIELHDDARMPTFDSRHRRMFRVAIRPTRASAAVTLARAGLVRADPAALEAAEHAEIAAAEMDARANRRGCLP